jgi:hypothetical protein
MILNVFGEDESFTNANSGAGTSYPSGALGFKYCVLALK